MVCAHFPWTVSVAQAQLRKEGGTGYYRDITIDHVLQVCPLEDALADAWWWDPELVEYFNHGPHYGADHDRAVSLGSTSTREWLDAKLESVRDRIRAAERQQRLRW